MLRWSESNLILLLTPNVNGETILLIDKQTI